jgi:hypothetical protein
MVRRREVMGGSLLAGLAALMVPRGAGAMTVEQRDENDRAAAAAIDRLREAVERQGGACELGQCGTIATIRNQQRVFMRANRKYPDYIDAGLEAWEDVYDWHVKNRQEVRASRLPDGRYGVQFMFTMVVLREDQTPGFVGWGYDAR